MTYSILDVPIQHYGASVMNTRADLDDAVRDFQRGRMGVLAA